MAQEGSAYNLEKVMEWLQPISGNARQVTVDAEKLQHGLRSITSNARNELMSLPPSDSSNLETCRNNLFDSLDDAKSSAQSLKASCDKLCKKCQKFFEYFKEASKKSENLSSSELDIVVRKLRKLKHYCTNCGQEYSATGEKLSKAINDCSLLVDALANEASRKKEQESNRERLGYGAALVAGAGAVGVAVASEGTAVPAIIGAKTANMAVVGLAVALVGAAAWTKVTSNTLCELSEKFKKARGSMSTTLRELNNLSDLISKLEKETTDLAKNIKTGINQEQRVKNALDEKDQEIQRLRGLVDKMPSGKD